MKIRKNLLKVLGVATLSLSFLVSSPAIIPSANSYAYYECKSKWDYGAHGWLFTRKEIKKIYEKEYEEGKRLENYVKIEDGKYIAFFDRKTFEISPRFIKKTLEHLEGMLEKGYAEYIFRLDASHSHLFVPNKIFNEKYVNPNSIELIEEYTQDEHLGALYHNAEHLALRNPPKTGEVDPVAKEFISKRNVLGWYDKRPLELTYPKEDANEKAKEANTASIPEGYHTIGNLSFKATKNGEFVIKPNGKEIRVDVSFDADYYY